MKKLCLVLLIIINILFGQNRAEVNNTFTWGAPVKKDQLNLLYDNDISTFCDIPYNKKLKNVLVLEFKRIITNEKILLTMDKNYPVKVYFSNDIINWQETSGELSAIDIEEKVQISVPINAGCKYIKIEFSGDYYEKKEIKSIKIYECEVFQSDIIEQMTTIEDFKLVNKTDTTFHIVVIISNPEQLQLNYGRSRVQRDLYTYSMNRAKKHSFLLDNLLPGSLYYFQVQSIPPGNIDQKGLFTFKTSGLKMPEIQKINIVSDSKTTTIILETNINTRVDFSLVDGKTYRINNFSKSHKIDIKGLESNKEYKIKIRLTDEYNRQTTTQHSFNTLLPNLAKHCPVYGTFNYNPEPSNISEQLPIINRITDNSYDYYTGMATSGNINKETQYFYIDLKEPRKIKNVLIYWRALAYPKKYTLYVSNDTETWVPVKSNIDGSRYPKQYKFGIPVKPVLTTLPNVLQVRYVKVEVPQNSPIFVKHEKWNFVQVMECLVLEAEDR